MTLTMSELYERDDKCEACGANPYEDCPRDPCEYSPLESGERRNRLADAMEGKLHTVDNTGDCVPECWCKQPSDVAGLCERLTSLSCPGQTDSRIALFLRLHNEGFFDKAAAMLKRQEREIERWQAEADRRTREVELTYSVQKRLTAQLEAKEALFQKWHTIAAEKHAQLEAYRALIREAIEAVPY